MSEVGEHGRWVRPVLAASAAVAVTVAVTALVTREAPRPDVAPPPDATTTASDQGSSGGPAQGWRTEYWHDVQVEVPADWWYGSSPIRFEPGDEGLFECGGGPMVSPDGDPATPRQMMMQRHGWVGRPIPLSDTCGSARTGDSVPVNPYLWFDSPLEPGLLELAEGWVEQTWEANGSMLTVATQDEDVREHVVASATGGETCLANRDDLDDPATRPEPTYAEGPLLCAYRLDGQEAWLSYAAPLTEDQMAAFTTAFEAAPAWGIPAGSACDHGDDREWVVLHDEETTYVVRPGFHGCPHVDDGAKLVDLTPELVEPWAVGGIPAVVYGPTGGKGAMIDSFIGGRG